MLDGVKRTLKKILPPGLIGIRQAFCKSNLTLQYYRAKGQLICLSKPVSCDRSSKFEIHILTCERDFLDAIWCLKTFYYYSGLKTRLVIHDDGSLTKSAVKHLQKNFLGCDLIMKNDADPGMRENLREYEYCLKYRFENFHPLAIKLFDPIFYTQTNRILLLDSDVLFFNKPLEIIKCMETDTGLFMNDYVYAYSLELSHLAAVHNVDIMDRINTGIIYIPDMALYDLGMIDSFLKEAHKRGFPNKWHTEQTAIALMISKRGGSFMRLPDSYQISKQPITERTISHHFVNDGSRSNYYTKGIRYLMKARFLRNFGKSRNDNGTTGTHSD